MKLNQIINVRIQLDLESEDEALYYPIIKWRLKIKT